MPLHSDVKGLEAGQKVMCVETETKTYSVEGLLRLLEEHAAGNVLRELVQDVLE